MRSQQAPWHLVGLALVIGGGVSNWIDRAVRGSVVDFMNIGLGWLRTGVFNIADVALMAGAATLLLAELRKGAHRRTR
jgi:signal peptidase II